MNSHAYSFEVTPGPKIYLWVNHPTRPHFRKYNKPVKNGIDFVEVLNSKMRTIEDKMMVNLIKPLFTESANVQ